MEKIRVFIAFSGYDSQCLALRRIGVPFELVGSKVILILCNLSTT